jgi:hypothetical protein
MQVFLEKNIVERVKRYKLLPLSRHGCNIIWITPLVIVPVMAVVCTYREFMLPFCPLLVGAAFVSLVFSPTSSRF